MVHLDVVVLSGTYNKQQILNPYTSYDSNYYAQSVTLLPNYTNKFSTGENWNYSFGNHYDPLLSCNL